MAAPVRRNAAYNDEASEANVTSIAGYGLTRWLVAAWTVIFSTCGALAQGLPGGTAGMAAPAPDVAAPSNAGSSPGSIVDNGDGTFYGTCDTESNGGNAPSGTVYKFDTAGNVTVLATFYGSSGMSPGGLYTGTDGNIYGYTIFGGNGFNGNFTGYGTFFKLVPNGVNSTVTNLWYFTSGSDGANPDGGLYHNADGSFYGLTRQGGDNNDGVIYKLTYDGTTAAVRNLWTFNGTVDGSGPSGFLRGPDGSLYGTTASGGRGGSGTIFRLDVSGTAPVVSTVAAFSGINGASPSGLIFGADGNLYGTTAGGGKLGYGTIFKLTTAGNLTTLLDFDGVHGISPSGITLARDGNFYGTALLGGPQYGGIFFRLTQTGKFTALKTFNPAKGSLWGISAPFQAKDGSFYGIAGLGSRGAGSIYAITLRGSTVDLLDLLDFTSSSPFPSSAAVRAISVSKDKATLVGICNPNGIDTTGYFEIGTDPHATGGHLDNSTQSSNFSFGSGDTALLLKTKFIGLQPSTTYYFRFWTTNSNNFSRFSGGPLFSTPGPPSITYDAPVNITRQGATLRGIVNPRGHTTSAYFQWGSLGVYGSKSPKSKIPGGIFGTPVSETVTGLSANMSYHYRVVATSSLGTTFGADQVFTTLP